MPEVEVVVAQCVVYMTLAPKSTAVYTAYAQAREAVTKFQALPVPLHLRNAPTKLMEGAGYGKGYVYTPAATASDAARQTYLPPEILESAGGDRKSSTTTGREVFFDTTGLSASRHEAGVAQHSGAKYAC